MKPDDERRFFEQRLQQAVPGLRLKSLELTPADMRDVSTGLRAELEFSVAGMTANGGGESVVTVPWIGKRLGVVNFILDGTGLEQRKYPLETEVTCRRAGGHLAQTRGRLHRRGGVAAAFIGGRRLRELSAAVFRPRTVRSNAPAR